MPDPFDLEEKIGKALIPKVKVSHSTSELIERAVQDPDISALFAYARQQEAFRRILFLHRADLFGIDAELQIPHFHYSSTALKPPTLADSIVIENALETGASVLGTDFSNVPSILEQVGLDEEQAMRYFDDIKDIAVYFLIEFIRRNPRLLELVNAPSFDYASMKRILKDYDGTVSFDPVLEMLTNSEPGGADPAVVKKMENLILAVVTAFSENLQSVLEGAHQVIPNLLLPFHLASAALIQKILKASGTDFDDYGTVLEGMYLKGLIQNESVVFWCQSCSVESPASEQRLGRIAPSKITKNRCLTCGKYQSYGSIYSLNEDLQEMFFCKDQLLAIYIGWMFAQKGIKFETGVSTSNYEHDFLLKHGVVSVKVFKAEKDEIAIRSELDSALAQLEKHVKELEQEGRSIKWAWLVWNRHGPVPDWPSLSQRYGTFLKKHSVVVLSPGQVSERVDSLE